MDGGIKLRPCPCCGGTPLVLVGMVAPRGGELRIECTACGLRTAAYGFGRAPGYDRPPILPPLEEVRRQAADRWNGVRVHEQA